MHSVDDQISTRQHASSERWPRDASSRRATAFAGCIATRRRMPESKQASFSPVQK